jgi:hypothetical protein
MGLRLRFLPVLGMIIGGLLPATALSAVEITVTGPAKSDFDLPADGTSLATLKVAVRGAEGKPLDSASVSATVDLIDAVEVVDGSVHPVGGEATVIVRSRSALKRTVVAVITVSATEKGFDQPGAVARVPVRLIGTGDAVVAGRPLDASRIVGALASFILMMMLVSIGAEKATDLMKMLATRSSNSSSPFQQPLEPLRTALGVELGAAARLPDDEIRRLCAVMLVQSTATTTAGTPTDPIECLQAMSREDISRAQALARWAWKWRLCALGFGVLFSVAFALDAFSYLRPLTGVRVVGPSADPWYGRGPDHWIGFLLTGFGASVGAAFWQDFLDRLTAWKKSAEAAKP